MSTPPCLMHLKIYDNRHHVNLWLPLFLAWLILLVFALALSPIVFILLLLFWPTEWGKFLLMLGPSIYSLLCALKGLRVDINGNKEVVLLSFK
jgi:hypothetical protein